MFFTLLWTLETVSIMWGFTLKFRCFPISITILMRFSPDFSGMSWISMLLIRLCCSKIVTFLLKASTSCVSFIFSCFSRSVALKYSSIFSSLQNWKPYSSKNRWNLVGAAFRLSNCPLKTHILGSPFMILSASTAPSWRPSSTRLWAYVNCRQLGLAHHPPGSLFIKGSCSSIRPNNLSLRENTNHKNRHVEPRIVFWYQLGTHFAIRHCLNTHTW